MTVYVLGEEQDRNNRITNENNALNSRIKNYQEELLEREKDIERLRESRKKMEVELGNLKISLTSIGGMICWSIFFNVSSTDSALMNFDGPNIVGKNPN